MSYTRISSDGTMAPQFKIGKSGPTILQGTTAPTSSIGNSGDLYVQTGASPRLYIKQTIGWVVSSDPVNGYTRQLVANSGTTQIAFGTTYVGVNAGAPATVQLMMGIGGKTIVVKDESGTAASNTITIIGQSGDTIDGQSFWNIDVNYGSMTLVYGVSGWNITGAITSAPFNTVKL